MPLCRNGDGKYHEAAGTGDTACGFAVSLVDEAVNLAALRPKSRTASKSMCI
jgi:hypothetical protein